ncbi:MAG: cystathionine beta-lyase, partial [Chloroflexi bacterium]|nr:cystathionine beta-lyase [Chloroflexota bacterium]
AASSLRSTAVKYDFDAVCDRKNTNCAKWDLVESMFGSQDVIPMWVADMDFPVAGPIVEALIKRAEHPFYGYTQPGPSVIQSVVERLQSKFNWRIEPDWIVFTPGVVPALNVAVRALTHPGDQIILQEPVYYPFFPAVTHSGCQIVNNGLKLVNDHYEMDYADLESKFLPGPGMHKTSPRVKGMILCNPHNPVGRVWKREELVRLGEIVFRHGAVVISDEIHCEILFQGSRHTSFATISEEFAQKSIICMSPSKTFSLAGLAVSSIIIPNKKLREDFCNMRSDLSLGPNLFGYTALEAAYRYGDEWLEQVLIYLQGNLEFLQSYFRERIPEIRPFPLQGTYLVWLDCRGLGMDNHSLRKFFREMVKVGLDDGFLFGKAGGGFERMNIACPRSILEEALKRIERAVRALRESSPVDRSGL